MKEGEEGVSVATVKFCQGRTVGSPSRFAKADQLGCSDQIRSIPYAKTLLENRISVTC